MKKKLTIKNALQIAKKNFRKIKNKESREYHLLHSFLVRETIKILSKYFKVDRKPLEIAAIVHDIGYVTDPKNHAEESLKILQKEFEIDDIVKDCILNHGSDKKPKTFEGKLFQLADKLCIFHPELIKYLITYRKNLKKEDYKFLNSILAKGFYLLTSFKEKDLIKNKSEVNFGFTKNQI